MTIKRLARICTLFISVLLASFCTSQSSYSTSFINGVLVGDATPGCLAASGTRSCWLPISTAPPITQISSAGDQTFGLDAGGTVWNLPLQSHTWQSMAYSPMAQIVALPGGNLYGLQLDATFCAAPEMRAFQYTAGATDFVKLGFCAVNIGAAPDGTLYRIRSSGNVSHLVNGTWISDPSAGGNGTPVKIVAGSVRNVWILTSTGVLKVLDYAGTNTFVVTAGIVSDITTSGDPLENTAETYVVGTSIVTNDVYKYSSNTNALNGTWTLLKGVEALNKISSGNHYTLVGLSTSTHSVYHFQPMRLTMTAGVTGNYNCHVFPNGQCPQGAYHTATVNAHFNVGGNSSSGTASGLPQTTLSAYAYPFTDDCDPIMGVFEFSSPGPACRITASSGVSCSAMGSIYSTVISGSITDYFEVATTLAARVTPVAGYNCTTSRILGIENCTWDVVPNCTTGSTPPTWIPTAITDSTPPLAAWWSVAGCVHSGTGQPWVCAGLPGGALKTPQTTPGICTKLYN
jgi:hypothetical protein